MILVTQKATVERSRHPRMVRKRSNDFKEKGASEKDNDKVGSDNDKGSGKDGGGSSK